MKLTPVAKETGGTRKFMGGHVVATNSVKRHFCEHDFVPVLLLAYESGEFPWFRIIRSVVAREH
eukprot:2072597-Pyramimonas_sp.AAC.1